MAAGFPKKITEDTLIPITVEKYGLYAISITASCSSKEDLRVEIDGRKFREVPPKDKPQYFNIPPAWNGSELKDLPKTIVFILRLNKGEHTLTFISTQSAFVEKYEIQPIENTNKLSFELNQQAEDGNGRPWYTFALIDLPLYSLSADVSIAWHFLDGDDVKLIVDGKSKDNTSSILHKYWIWAATPLILLSGGKREKKSFIENLSSGIHYIEFWADKTPTLHTVTLNFGDVSMKRIPTVNDPKWTGDFTDDTEQILLARLILGEMANESREAKTGAAYSVLNRLKKHRSNWGYTIKEIILKPQQYDAMWNKNTSGKVRDPLSFVPKNLWKECFEIAGLVLNKKTTDPTRGATHFYSTSTDDDFPLWATDDVFKIKIGITYFYELER